MACRCLPRAQIATMPEPVQSIFFTVTVTPRTAVSNGTARLSPIMVANPVSSSSSL